MARKKSNSERSRVDGIEVVFVIRDHKGDWSRQ
jgi:hypothetical protein